MLHENVIANMINHQHAVLISSKECFDLLSYYTPTITSLYSSGRYRSIMIDFMHHVNSIPTYFQISNIF